MLILGKFQNKKGKEKKGKEMKEMRTNKEGLMEIGEEIF